MEKLQVECVQFEGLDHGREGKQYSVSGKEVRLPLEISGCLTFSSLATNLPSREIVSYEYDLSLLKLTRASAPAVRKKKKILFQLVTCVLFSACSLPCNLKQREVSWGAVSHRTGGAVHVADGKQMRTVPHSHSLDMVGLAVGTRVSEWSSGKVLSLIWIN